MKEPRSPRLDSTASPSGAGSEPPVLGSRVAGATVFGASAAVLVIEILAARMLAPYSGLTLETYTAVIGVVLGGIALGSLLGGRLADRVDPRLTIGPLLLAGGVLAALTLPTVRLIGPRAPGGDAGFAVLLAMLAFFAPAAVLSAVAPNVVKLRVASLEEVGGLVGRLSALGTLGAILGTFATGFLLVAKLPIALIVIAVAALLLVAGTALTLCLRAARRHVAGSLVAGVALAALGAALGSPCQAESAYFCARVEPDPARASARVLVLDTIRQSHVDLEDPTYLGARYAEVLAAVVDAAGPPGAPIAALHVGGGGFTMPRYVGATRPGSRSVVLELDPNVVRLARERLGLVTGPGLRVVTGDARVSIRAEDTRSFDLVIGDAFGGLTVPWHLTTREFLAEVRRRLRPGGIYALNVIDLPPLGFARAEAATLLASFRHVALLAPREHLAGRTGGNFIFVASDRPLPEAAWRGRLARPQASTEDGEPTLVASGRSVVDFARGARVLSDDFAPVDQLLTPR